MCAESPINPLRGCILFAHPARYVQASKFLLSVSVWLKPISSWRRLHINIMRVTQATLSRGPQELRLVKRADGYRMLGANSEGDAQSRLAHALREFQLDVRGAEPLVLKTPPGGALAAIGGHDRRR